MSFESQSHCYADNAELTIYHQIYWKKLVMAQKQLLYATTIKILDNFSCFLEPSLA